MAEAAPAPVDPVAAIASLIGHARALAPNLCPSLYPAGFPSDVTDILLSKGLDPAVIAKQLQAAGNCIAACAPQDSRIISVFAIDASRRTFKFSGLQAVPADVASFAHCDICTNEVRCCCCCCRRRRHFTRAYWFRRLRFCCDCIRVCLDKCGQIMSGSGCGAADALQRWAAANKIKV